MKKFAFALLAMIGLASCTKEEGNKGVLKQDQPTTENMEKALIPGANTYTYRGLEGVRAKVIFENTEKANTVTIQANNNRFQLDKKSESKGEVQYERAGIKAVAKGDSLIVEQNGNVIPLAWDN